MGGLELLLQELEPWGPIAALQPATAQSSTSGTHTLDSFTDIHLSGTCTAEVAEHHGKSMST